jgi:hypothetical protein
MERMADRSISVFRVSNSCSQPLPAGGLPQYSFDGSKGTNCRSMEWT